MGFRHGILHSLTALAAGVIAAAPTAHAQDSQGAERVTVSIGYPVGGGFDRYGRLVARNIGRFLPGHPSVIAKNMPGAGSLRLANYLYNVAPKDGTEFGIIGSSVPFGPLWSREGVHFDATKFGWIGSLDSWDGIAVVWHSAKARTIQDATKQDVVVGATGSGDVTVIYPKLLNTLIGTKFKIVAGYKGTKDLTLAMEQGEIDGRLGWCWACLKADKPDWVRDKKIRVLLQLGLKPHPDLAGIPMAIDLARNDEDRKIMRMVFASQVMARPFVAPPGLPADRLGALRDAFQRMAKDPAFLKDAQKVHANINLTTWQEIQSLITDVYETPKPIVERAAAIVGGK